MTVFEFSDYREFLKKHIESQPRKGWGIITKIADSIEMKQAHISQVLSGNKDFSLEQGLRICQFLQLSATETDHFLILLHYQRAATADLKKYYSEKIEASKLEGLKMSNFMKKFADLSAEDMQRFYSSWIYSAVRMICSIDNGKTSEEIMTHFQLSPKELSETIGFLLGNGLLKREGHRYVLGAQRTLAPKGSPHFLQHAKNWRLQSIQRCEKMKDEDLYITSPMSLSKSDYEKIRSTLLESLKSISKQVEASPAEVTVCLNIDLFRF